MSEDPAPLRFDPAQAADGATLLAMARAFHAEDRHPLAPARSSP